MDILNKSTIGKDRFSEHSLREWLPVVVGCIVEKFNPVSIIVFGSVVRNEDGPDSDLDLLVVFDEVERSEIIRLMGKVRRAISLPIPCDVIVTDLNEYDLKKNVNGSALYWPAHEGEIIYERIAS